jgi:hypothetical protein
MDRCAILVDAGYLLGAAGDAACARPRVDYPALVSDAQQQTGLPVRR